MQNSNQPTKEKLYISILYVEDEENIRNVLTKILLRKFRDVIIARNGAEGIEQYEAHHPDIIITDIRMPEMNGLEMIEHIRAINPEVPVIITTAFTDAEYFIDAFHLGVNRFILKPIDSDQLEQAIYALIEEKRKNQELKDVNQLLNEYRKAVDSSAIVSKTDRQGVITYVNSAFCEISGYTQEELIGHSHNIVRHPMTPDSVFKELWSTILDGKTWKGRIQNRRKNGASYTVEATIIPICDSDGEIIEFIAVRYDITELLAMQEEMESYRIRQLAQSVQKASELRLRTLLDSMPTPAFILDSDDNIVAFNDASESLFDLYLHKDWISKLKESALNLREIASKNENLFDTPIDWKELPLDMYELPIISLEIPISSSNYIIGIKNIKGEASERFLLLLTPLPNQRIYT
ncbi:MAG: response regulator [Wolinella sp.]